MSRNGSRSYATSCAFLGFPFGGSPFMLVDIFLLLASGVVGYLGFNALRDLR